MLGNPYSSSCFSFTCLCLTTSLLSTSCEAQLGAEPPSQHHQTADGGPTEAAPPQALSSEVAIAPGIDFQVGKWLDAEGYETAMVGGRFEGFDVAFSRPVLSLQDNLSDLQVTVTIDLMSLNSGSEIRDENIRDSYFNVQANRTSTATFSEFQIVGPGAAVTPSIVVSARAVLALHPVHALELRALLEISEQQSEYRIRTLEPIQVDTMQGMPVQALLARCNHLGIDPSASVTFDVRVPRPTL